MAVFISSWFQDRGGELPSHSSGEVITLGDQEVGYMLVSKPSYLVPELKGCILFVQSVSGTWCWDKWTNETSLSLTLIFPTSFIPQSDMIRIKGIPCMTLGLCHECHLWVLCHLLWVCLTSTITKSFHCTAGDTWKEVCSNPHSSVFPALSQRFLSDPRNWADFCLNGPDISASTLSPLASHFPHLNLGKSPLLMIPQLQWLDAHPLSCTLCLPVRVLKC